jgi:hypothetical protein
MKVTNKVTIELTIEEATKLAKLLEMDIYDTDGFEYKLKEQLCEALDVKPWDL